MGSTESMRQSTSSLAGLIFGMRNPDQTVHAMFRCKDYDQAFPSRRLRKSTLLYGFVRGCFDGFRRRNIPACVKPPG